MSNLLNQFFASVYTVEDPILHEPSRLDVTDKLVIIEIAAGNCLQDTIIEHCISTRSRQDIPVLKETAGILCFPLNCLH